ncbi:MAG: hypothetical protein MUC87_01915 [Bacteroidia bacterium]|jgi:hypothetical protein|nr:hypothetical protein [Bacteroidia bacterium]
MTDQRITDLFSRLNELPSEVPLSEVEHWARLHAAGQLLPQSPHIGAPGKLPWYSFKPPLYMTSIIIAGAASGLAALIAVNTTNENPAPQVQHKPAVALTDTTLLNPLDTPVVTVNVKQNPNGDSLRREYTINAPANARITVSASDEDAVTNVEITPEGVESSTAVNTDEVNEYAFNYNIDDNGNVDVNVYPSNDYDECHCNTHSDSIQKEFVKQLVADGIITNSRNYSFAIDMRRFTVNGKRQPADVHVKYLRLYEKLNGDNRISGSFSWQVQVSSN